MSSGLRWVLFGLLGLLVAAAVAFLAIQTVSEKIGITAEPPSAGSALAPRATAVKKADAARADSRAEKQAKRAQAQSEPTGDGYQGEDGEDHEDDDD